MDRIGNLVKFGIGGRGNHCTRTIVESRSRSFVVLIIVLHGGGNGFGLGGRERVQAVIRPSFRAWGMAVPAELTSRGIGGWEVGIEIWNDEAELVCFMSRAAVTSAGCLCAFCAFADRKRQELPGSPAALAALVSSSRMERFIPPPLRSSSAPGAVLGEFGGLEKKTPNAAVEARIADLSLSSLKEDTSTSGATRERWLTLSGMRNLCFGSEIVFERSTSVVVRECMVQFRVS